MTTLREKVERLAEKWERFSGSLLCLSGVESDRLFICARELRALLASPEATTARDEAVAALRECVRLADLPVTSTGSPATLSAEDVRRLVEHCMRYVTEPARVFLDKPRGSPSPLPCGEGCCEGCDAGLPCDAPTPATRLPPRTDDLTCGSCVLYRADGRCGDDVDRGLNLPPVPSTYPACRAGYMGAPASPAPQETP
jgi:hypothetical protein